MAEFFFAVAEAKRTIDPKFIFHQFFLTKIHAPTPQIHPTFVQILLKTNHPPNGCLFRVLVLIGLSHEQGTDDITCLWEFSCFG